MARSQKRQRADEASQDGGLAKARKKDEINPLHSATRTHRDRDQFALGHHDSSSWQYPPEFWDRLSTVPLIHEALEEHDRRRRSQPSFPPPPTGLAQDLAPTAPKELARFARHGGPDLCDLRGYSAPATSNINHRPAIAIAIASAMSSTRNRATRSIDPLTAPTTYGTTNISKSSTPYHRAFEQHLTDHAIHSDWRSRQPGLGELLAALASPRPSLSLSGFSDSAFRTFRENDSQAMDEEDVSRHVLPAITGVKQNDHPCAINPRFANLEPLTDGTITPAQPDMYYGAYPEQLNPSIRNELHRHIVPSTMGDKPIAPNFFLECKGPTGSLAVATRQARYDGALGARAMHSLQNYGAEEPVYDGNAYAFSSIYHGGQLKLYAHHVTAPTAPREQPEYHMTLLRVFATIDTRERFLEGATAFRNLCDLARQYRDTFIQTANSRTQSGAVVAQNNLPTAEEQADGGLSYDKDHPGRH
ncbi:hypothetical protein VPNG_02890 [Cytospora leucostoma]|uniref:DUF7924 domain-containing protein n=1 Tax=Cytospora leucostoma TaxID=1230097 RepID=A0A423XJ98_9PEZI|nr:hypothetical protein VPNG_02890 [Cytospora leucostoma]